MACIFLLTFAGKVQGQPGALDPSFNPGDWLSLHPQQEGGTVESKVRLTDPAQGAAVGAAAESIVPIDDDAQASIFEMSLASLGIPETAGTAGIRVRRMGSLAAGATVAFEVVTTTANSTADFVLSAGELVFSEGEQEKTISFAVLQDALAEGDEHFQVRLTGMPVGGQLGSLVSTTVTIVDSNDAGSLDEDFQVAMTGANRAVHCLLVQNDGKVILGGKDLGEVGGKSLLRLNPDGSIDPSFQESLLVPPVVAAIVSQPDGRLLVAGSEADWPGPGSTYFPKNLLRLHADGTLDPTFDAGSVSKNLMCLAVLPNGSVIAGGFFNGSFHSLLRFKSNGSIDLSFKPPQLGAIKHLARLDDGSMVVAGDSLSKLTPAGNIDTGFPTRQMQVTALKKDLEGRLLVSGIEGSGAAAINVVRRLLPNGALDENFAAATDLLGPAAAFAVLPDGRILAAGRFKTYAGVSCGPVVRLLPNGALDPTFSTFMSDPEGQPAAIGYSLEGDIYVGGTFSSIDGQSVPGIARLRGSSLVGNYFRFERAGFDVQEETAGKVQVRVLRLGTAESTAKVEWTVEKSGSKNSSDNYTRTGELEFAPGVRDQTIELEVNDDEQSEADEFFTVSLREPTAGLVIAAPAAIRIGVKSAEAPNFGTIQFAAETLRVSEEEGKAEVVVHRAGGSDGLVSVNYVAYSDSALEERDFASASGTLTFANGETSRIITIRLTRDILAEPEESFSVMLWGVAGGATLGNTVSTRVFIADSNARTPETFRGTYHGSIVTDGGATVAGRVSMTLTKSGIVTGTVQLKDKRYSFRMGGFHSSGDVEILISARPLPSLYFRLSLDPTEGSGRIVGYFEHGGLTAQVELRKAVFDSKKNPTFAAGAYTLLCKPTPNAPVAVPLGTGFASLKVSRAGSMRWTGRLADGQSVSFTGVVDESGTCYFYVPLAKARGSLAGELHFAQSEQRDCSGEAEWRRNEKAGQPWSSFFARLELTGSAFVPSKRAPLLSWNQGTLSLISEEFPEQPPIAIQQSRPQRFVPLPPSLGLSLTVDPASGLLRGKFQHPTTKKNVSLSGAVLTDEGRGAGYFLAPEPGGFEMNAAIVP